MLHSADKAVSSHRLIVRATVALPSLSGRTAQDVHDLKPYEHAER